MSAGKEPKPDIPKMNIAAVGELTERGLLTGWVFNCDGMSDYTKNKTVGRYTSEYWDLIGGYTIDELREIKAKGDI